MASLLLSKNALEDKAVGKKSEDLLKNMQKFEDDDFCDLEKTEEIDLNAMEKEETPRPKKKISSKKKKNISDEPQIFNDFSKVSEEKIADNIKKEIATFNSNLSERLDCIQNEWGAIKEINSKVFNELEKVTKIVVDEQKEKGINAGVSLVTKLAFALSGVAFILSLVSLIVTSSTRQNMLSSYAANGKDEVAVTKVMNRDFLKPMNYKTSRDVPLIKPTNVIKQKKTKAFNSSKMTKKR